jgi:hypothetical protein
MRLDEILTEDQLDEINWKKGVASAAAWNNDSPP